ncbi:hypothetical protein F5Y17DRAFT_72011 [Xylariaceae sp. FL0594]|nr:hypothetical protein F5Y17DRAFT_72011 [Xylariaceae sp. FL0594]
MQYDEGYEDSDYDDGYLTLDDEIELDLTEYQGGDAETHGELKSQFKSDGNLVYWSDDPDGFTIKVERLLQADGYADSSKSERLTLFIFKVGLSSNSDSRIRHAKFEIRFKDMDEGRSPPAKPQVEAWAPFSGETYRQNPVTVKRTNRTTVGLDLGGGFGGFVNATGKAERERSAEWTQTYWDKAQSIGLYDENRSNRTRNGVRWVIEANPRDTEGVPSNLVVGILLSRQSDAPYLASFEVKVTGATMDNLRTGIKRMFGQQPRSTQPYKIKPSAAPVFLRDGRDMAKYVKLDAMRELQGPWDSLLFKWDGEDQNGNSTKPVLAITDAD